MGSKKRIEGDAPINSRIRIDYTGDKPDVQFQFPDKRNQHRGSMFAPIFIVWEFLFCLIIIGFILSNLTVDNLYGMGSNYSNYSTCTTHYRNLYKNKIGLAINKSANNSCTFEKDFGDAMLSKTNLSRVAMMFLILFGGVFLPPCLIYFPFRRKWNKLYPECQALLARKKERNFKIEDIKKDSKGKFYCELPLFENIILDYEAKGDFGKYLDYFEIREHKFEFLTTLLLRRKKRKINEWLWYARFYFKKKPKKGELNVIFK